MAIKVLNSQGTKVFVLPDGTDMGDCAKVVAAIQGSAAKLVGCPQSLGDLSETRSSTEYKCLSSNESVKALGGISRGSLELGLLLDPDDAAGQRELKVAFAENKPVIIGIELPNNPTALPATGGNGTIYWFIASVSGVSTGIAMDAAISYSVTLEISSSISECPASVSGVTAPTGLKAPTFASITADSATVNWSAPTGGDAVTGYEVVIETTTGAVALTGSPFAVQAGKLTLDVTGMVASTDYEVHVTAKSAAGNANSPSGTLSTTA